MILKKRILLPVFAAFMIFSGAQAKEAATPTELTQTAYKYIGVPYVYGGSTTSGFDCSAFTQTVFKDLGFSIPRTTGGQYTTGQNIAKSNLQVGDLVFFNTMGSGVSHVGIYIGESKFIHSQTGQGVSVSSLNDPYYWGKRYLGAKRVAALTAGEVKKAAIDFTVYASRAEVAMQLAEALNLDTSKTAAVFKDVKENAKYTGAATALHKLGIFSGDEKGKFNPSSPITRAQLAKILVVAFDLQQKGDAPTFADVPKSHWAHDYVATLASTNITSGKGDGNFAADEFVTIKHLQAFIDKAAQVK